jgi:hypothetical protein
MHDAYQIDWLLKSPTQVQFECITTYGSLSFSCLGCSVILFVPLEDNLLVGSKQGHLLMYSITQKPGDHKLEVQLLKLIKTFSKKPINQLAVVPEFEMLISLSGT